MLKNFFSYINLLKLCTCICCRQGEFAEFAEASFPSPPSGPNSPTAAPSVSHTQQPTQGVTSPSNLLDDLEGLSIGSSTVSKPGCFTARWL